MGLKVDRNLFPKSRSDAIWKAINEGRWPLYFFGPAGRGKTYAAAIVCADFPCKAIGAKMWPAAKIISDVLSAQFNGGLGAIHNTVRDADLIVIDDVVDRNMTDARRGALLDIMRWRGDKPMILTGNFAPTNLGDALQDDRLVDRILGGKHLEFGGLSMRTAGAKVVKV